MRRRWRIDPADPARIAPLKRIDALFEIDRVPNGRDPAVRLEARAAPPVEDLKAVCGANARGSQGTPRGPRRQAPMARTRRGSSAPGLASSIFSTLITGCQLSPTS
ncbi:hypothetical protein RSP03_32720 [Cereibacter sphaeroides]|nr:hypothetical protein RSP03_32720 [Cereibacter sphaeroides]